MLENCEVFSSETRLGALMSGYRRLLSLDQPVLTDLRCVRILVLTHSALLMDK